MPNSSADAGGEWSGVIDIGSNSVLLLVARRFADGTLDVRLDQSTVTRLSEGAGRSGSLRPEAISRTLACLREYAEIVARFGCTVRAVATEGLRMVANPRAFLVPAADILGRDVELISGEQEARLSYLSVARETPPGTALRVLDIGGGSTELVLGTGQQVESAHSHRIGSVRLTEAHIDTDPPSKRALTAIEAAARESFAGQVVTPQAELHGLAGTITSSAALMLGLERYERRRVDGTRFSLQQVRALRDQLAGETLAARLQHAALGKGRADVIVAGVTILLCALEHCGAETLVVRDRGLRYALL